MDSLTIILAAIVVAVLFFIVRAIKQTRAEIDQRFENMDPARRETLYKDLAAAIRSRDVRCARCPGQAFALVGTGNRYKCHSCNFEFEGPPHIPDKEGPE